MNIISLCCTHGRYKCLQRAVKCFIDQDYKDPSLLLIYNSGDPLELSSELQKMFSIHSNKRIVIHNIYKGEYDSVGEKYNMALAFIMNNFPMVDVIVCSDDDDLYLKNHLSEGVKGFNKAKEQGKLAYKPSNSYYRSIDGMFRNGNNYEGSIFVDANYLKEAGFAPVSVKYHQQWLDPLIQKGLILEDPNGVSTFIYNWGDNWDTYKLSGLGQDNDLNFQQHKTRSLDMGNGILIPNESNQGYYDEVKFAKQL